MYSYVFVYSPSKFRVDGDREQLKQFAANQMYTTVDAVISDGEEKVLDPGIYVIESDGDVSPGLHAVDARITVDYDQVTIADKDPWPTIIGDKYGIDPAVHDRVIGAFPTLRDEDLQGFYISQNARAG